MLDSDERRGLCLVKAFLPMVAVSIQWRNWLADTVATRDAMRRLRN